MNKSSFVAPINDNLLNAVYNADRVMRPSYLYSDQDKRYEVYAEQDDEPQNYVHLKLVDGAFIGHFWIDEACVVVLDGNFAPILHFRETGVIGADSLTNNNPSKSQSHSIDRLNTSKISQSYSQGQIQPNGNGLVGSNGSVDIIGPSPTTADILASENARHSSTVINVVGEKNSKVVSINPRPRRKPLRTTPINYDLWDGNQIIGHVNCLQSLEKFNINAKLQNCYGSIFPSDFTQVDKALILGFMLYKQRKVSTASKVCYGFLGFLILSAILLTVFGAAVIFFH